MPSVDEAAIVEFRATAAKTPPPYATDLQFAETGSVLCVHVIPSVDVATAVEPPVTTAAKTPPPYATDCHLLEEGRVLCVQVIPSVEEAAVVEEYATAAKTPPPYATD
jgi:hypothetical protein